MDEAFCGDGTGPLTLAKCCGKKQHFARTENNGASLQGLLVLGISVLQLELRASQGRTLVAS